MLAALRRMPLGGFEAVWRGRRYGVVRTVVAGGRGHKLVARALDGGDHVSLNLYDLTAGPALRPCEMPAAKVAAFATEARPVPPRTAPPQ